MIKIIESKVAFCNLCGESLEIHNYTAWEVVQSQSKMMAERNLQPLHVLSRFQGRSDEADLHVCKYCAKKIASDYAINHSKEEL